MNSAPPLHFALVVESDDRTLHRLVACPYGHGMKERGLRSP